MTLFPTNLFVFKKKKKKKKNQKPQMHSEDMIVRSQIPTYHVAIQIIKYL